jgi:hypothetical protein
VNDRGLGVMQPVHPERELFDEEDLIVKAHRLGRRAGHVVVSYEQVVEVAVHEFHHDQRLAVFGLWAHAEEHDDVRMRSGPGQDVINP